MGSPNVQGFSLGRTHTRARVRACNLRRFYFFYFTVLPWTLGKGRKDKGCSRPTLKVLGWARLGAWPPKMSGRSFFKWEVWIAEILERRGYRDPLDLLISLENGTCAGCAWVRTEWGEDYCDKGKLLGRKCKQYAEQAEVVDSKG